jgi:Tfp pilus assembly protein PilV
VASGTSRVIAPRRRRPAGGEEGMSLVEVMVAIFVLVVGVIGVVAMLDTGNRITSHNIARDAATALAREQLEQVRGLAYTDLSDAAAVAADLVPLIAGSGSRSGATFQTVRHGVTFTTAISSCVVDDPSDGLGGAPGTPCNPLPPSSGGGAPVATSGSSSLSLNILGIQITGGGNIVEAACNLVGRNAVLDGLLGASGGALGTLISTGADTSFCSSSARNVAFDRQPADATAVRTTVTWSLPRTGNVTQRAVVTGPRVTP